MIFMGDREEVCNFLTPQKKKRVKFVFEKSQNFEKNIIFLKVYPLSTHFTLFALFCKKIVELDICSFIYADKSIKKYFTLF